MLFADGLPAHEWSFLLNPGPIDMDDPAVAEAFDVNGIDPAHLKKAPFFAEAYSRIVHALGVSAISFLYAAHNARFDWRMLTGEVNWAIRRSALHPAEAFVWRGLERRITLDTMALDIVLHPEKRKRNLEAVASYWGVEGWNKHRAAGDAEASGRILLAMAPDLPADIEEVCLLQAVAQKKHDDEIAARKAEEAAKGGTGS